MPDCHHRTTGSDSQRVGYSWMRSFSDSTSLNNGTRTSRNSALNPSANFSLTWYVPHLGSRSPKDFTNPRDALTNAVRALTSSARARITVRWICACAKRLPLNWFRTSADRN